MALSEHARARKAQVGPEPRRLWLMPGTQSAPAADNVWNVWPYSWAIAAGRWMATCWASAREEMIFRHLTKSNRRAVAAFLQKSEPEETRLRLV